MYDFEANWQPIETAPKDGTRVLGWDGESGWYSCEFEKLEGAWVAVPFSISGWDPHHVSPTHWMPLPEPPDDTP